MTGTECRGKLYRFSENILTNKPDPRAVWEQDQGVRRKWWHVLDRASVFDMGCGYGHWTLAAIAQGAQMVYALEDDYDYYRAMLDNVIENHYYDHCTPLRAKEELLNLDEFIDGLSIPPEKVQFIRFNYIYSLPEMLTPFLNNARKTITKYKPTLITMHGPQGNVELGNIVSELNRPYDKKIMSAGASEYCLVQFR